MFLFTMFPNYVCMFLYTTFPYYVYVLFTFLLFTDLFRFDSLYALILCFLYSSLAVIWNLQFLFLLVLKTWVWCLSLPQRLKTFRCSRFGQLSVYHRLFTFIVSTLHVVVKYFKNFGTENIWMLKRRVKVVKRDGDSLNPRKLVYLYRSMEWHL